MSDKTLLEEITRELQNNYGGDCAFGGISRYAYKVANRILALFPAHPEERLREAATEMLAVLKSWNAIDGGDWTRSDLDRWEKIVTNTALSPAPAAPPAPKCTCIRATIGGGIIHLRACPVHGDKANPETWAAEPPAPKRWKCTNCGVEVEDAEVIAHADLPTTIMLWHRNADGMFCGPVEEVRGE